MYEPFNKRLISCHYDLKVSVTYLTEIGIQSINKYVGDIDNHNVFIRFLWVVPK